MNNSPVLRLLTDEHGPYPLPHELRRFVCLTAEGILYVSHSHRTMPEILAFIDHLSHEQQFVTIRLTDIEFIANCYSQSSLKSEWQDVSVCQNRVSEIIQQAVQVNASDVHILVRQLTTQIKFRVNGELQLQAELSAEEGQTICATIYQTMCDVAEPVFNPHRSQDARLMPDLLKTRVLYGGRIATRPTDSGLLMVIRLLYDRGSSNLQLEDLGYLPGQISQISHMAARRFGINILSGPTGSGKSTTLECLLKRLIAQREQKAHILTMEDPPEYCIQGAVQTPIICDKDDDAAVNREWGRAIANAMRLDPDVLMCGEVRDQASAIASFRAAMTGHGVWTTLHANDALAILTRLRDIGVSDSLLEDASLITGLINQVLVKKLCEHCKQPYRQQADQLPKALRQRIEQTCQAESIYLRGPGCQHCQQRGIAGRTVVAEVVEPNGTLLELFLRQGKQEARHYWLKHLQGRTKNANLITLIDQGLVDPRDGEQDVCMLDHDSINDGQIDSPVSRLKSELISYPTLNPSIRLFKKEF